MHRIPEPINEYGAFSIVLGAIYSLAIVCLMTDHFPFDFTTFTTVIPLAVFQLGSSWSVIAESLYFELCAAPFIIICFKPFSSHNKVRWGTLLLPLSPTMTTYQYCGFRKSKLSAFCIIDRSRFLSIERSSLKSSADLLVAFGLIHSGPGKFSLVFPNLVRLLGHNGLLNQTHL